jgi:hypothetical protein
LHPQGRRVVAKRNTSSAGLEVARTEAASVAAVMAVEMLAEDTAGVVEAIEGLAVGATVEETEETAGKEGVEVIGDAATAVAVAVVMEPAEEHSKPSESVGLGMASWGVAVVGWERLAAQGEAIEEDQEAAAGRAGESMEVAPMGAAQIGW